MNVIEEITDIVNKLDKIDEYASTLQDKLKIENGKEQDLLHFIENNKINVLWCYRFAKELQKVRLTRRKIKNDIELTSRYFSIQNKLALKKNRQSLIEDMNDRSSQLDMPYQNRQYTEEELQKILKGVI